MERTVNRLLALVTFVCIAPLLALPARGVNFFPPVDVDTGSGPTHHGAQADFDQDGDPDVVLGHDLGVSVYFNQGNGTFSLPPYALALAEPAEKICICDFDEDTYPDILLAAPLSSSFQIYLNLQNGSFDGGLTYVSNTLVSKTLACGIGTNDASPDTVTGTTGPDTLNFWRGRGDGALGIGPPNPLGVSPVAGTSIDMEADGYTEFLLLIGQDVEVYSGTTGPLVLQDTIGLPYAAENLKAGIVGTDSHADVLVSNSTGFDYSDSFLLLEDPGTGSFLAPVSYDPLFDFTSLGFMDLNDDGGGDVLLTSADPSPYLTAHYWVGGGFTPSGQTYAISDQVKETLSTDINMDGFTDAAVIYESGGFSLFLSAGTADYSAPSLYDVGLDPRQLAIADMDGDGDLDLAVTVAGATEVIILENAGDGTFGPMAPGTPAGLEPFGIAVQKLDDDGMADMVVTDRSSSRVGVYRATGPAAFDTPTWINLDQRDEPTDVVLGDLDNDGTLDAVTANTGSDTITVLLGIGEGLKTELSYFTVGMGPSSVDLYDFDNDGNLDIATANPDDTDLTKGVAILWGSGDGTYTQPDYFTAGQGPLSLAAGDLDGDGFGDIAVANGSDGTFSILKNLGGRTFDEPSNFASGSGPTSIELTHANCDGSLDIAITDFDSGDLLVHLNEGAGTYAPPQRFTAGQGPIFVASGDLDRVGRDDLAVIYATDEAIGVFLNDACQDNSVCLEERDPMPVEACAGEPLTLHAPSGYEIYRWSTGSSDPSITLLPPPGLSESTVRCTGHDGCIVEEQYNVNGRPSIAAKLIPDRTYVCSDPANSVEVGVSLSLTPLPEDFSGLEWRTDTPYGTVEFKPPDQAVLRFAPATPSGTYRLILEANLADWCPFQDSIEMTVLDPGDPYDGPESGGLHLSKGAQGILKLELPETGAPLMWLDLSTTKQGLENPDVSFLIDEHGTYALETEGLPHPLYFFNVRFIMCP